MSKRLQVILDDAEYMRYRKAAEAEGLTVSDWARRTLRQAQRVRATSHPDKKLAVIRAGARSNFPTADIDTMLADIERT